METTVKPRLDEEIRHRLDAIPHSFKKVEIEKTDADIYQRLLSEGRDGNGGRVGDIVSNWCSALTIVPVLIHEGDGTYKIVDGQHTLAAARKRGDKTFHCKVFDPMPQDLAAWLFVHLNKERKGLTARELHKAKYVYGDSSAVRINKICDELGLVVEQYASRKEIPSGKIPVVAVNAMYAIIERFEANREDTLEATLRTIKNAFITEDISPSLGGKQFNQQFMLALAQVYDRAIPAPDEKRMTDLLKLKDNVGGVHSKAEKKSGSVGVYQAQYVDAIISIYNEGDTGQAKSRLPKLASGKMIII